MKGIRIQVGVVVAGLTVAAVLAGGAGAVSTSSTYNFFNCHTEAGTIPPFTAVKQAVPAENGVSAAAAFHIIDGGSGVFVVLSFGGEGFFSPPGITVSGVATTSCDVVTNSRTLTFSGFIAH